MPNDQTNAFLRQLAGEHSKLKAEYGKLSRQWAELMRSIEEQPKSITEEIDSIPGRRIFYNLTGRQTFDISKDGRRGDPINFLVSQDGPFVMTHYPLVIWKPSAPSNATNLGFWRPVSHWPLPDQVVDSDIVDLSYEVVDGGAQRNFQNAPSPAGPFSRPDALIPLPVPTLAAPNSTLQFIATFERILFFPGGGEDVATEQGQLAVALPGYRIVNL